MKIPITIPELDDSEIQEISRVIKSGWITQGPEVAEFEREFCKYVNSDFAVAVSSCTTALYLALKIIGIKENFKLSLFYLNLEPALAMEHPYRKL